MRAKAEMQPPEKADPKLLHRLFLVDHICMLAVLVIAVINLFPGALTPLGEALPVSLLDMRMSCTAMTLCGVLSLFCAEVTQSRRTQRLGTAFGILMLAIAAASLVVGVAGSEWATRWIFDRNQVAFLQGSLAFSSAVFFLLAVAILLADCRSPRLAIIADVVTCILFFVVFGLSSEFLFRLAGVHASPTAELISIPALFCLSFLTLGVVFRRTEGGVLSLLWGYGTGSRIARMLAPILLVLPMLREIARAHLLKTGLIPAGYATALLTSTATLLAFILLFLLTRMINRMQQTVQDATLRDELTGLLSVRGFYLLAEQAFRQSRRVQEPFSVLFIDMDNLKKINDELGHSMGSVSLVETAKLLIANFRDTDVIGRVGGDEFVVVGHFDRSEVTAAVERLRAAVARKNEVVGPRFSISLSIGCAVIEDFARETLQSLLLKADEAMYAEKRAKKNARLHVAPRPQAELLR